MASFALISAVSFLLLLTLGVRIFQEHGGKPSRLFGAYALAAAFVSFLELMIRLSESRERAMAWAGASWSWPMAPALFVHFALVAALRAGRLRRVLVVMTYAGAGLMAVLYALFVHSGNALEWRYGWALTSPVTFEWPWAAIFILSILYEATPLALFLFRVVRPGGVLAPREQRWFLLAYVARFVITGATRTVSGVFGVAFPELNSLAYLTFAVLVFMGISRAYLLSLTPQKTVGAILSKMDELLFLTGRDATIIIANRSAGKLLGVDSQSLQGQSLTRLFGLTDLEPVTTEARIRDSMGTVRDIQLLRTEVRSPSGETAGLVMLGRDVTEDRTRELALRKLVEEKEAVLRELQHRVYNTLQTVISILNLKASEDVGQETSQSLIGCADRVDRIAQVYRRAYDFDDFEAVRFDELLQQLAMDIYQVSRGAPSVELVSTIEPVKVSIRVAIPLLLIAGEITTNAFEHAYPDPTNSRTGTVQVTLRRISEAACELRVEDNGIGFDRAAASHGSGLAISEALAGQIGATIIVTRSPGTQVSVVFPAS